MNLRDFIDVLEKHPETTSAAVAIGLAVLGYFFGFWKWLFSRRNQNQNGSKSQKAATSGDGAFVVQAQDNAQVTLGPAIDEIEKYEALVEKRIAEARQHWDVALGAEKTEWANQIA